MKEQKVKLVLYSISIGIIAFIVAFFLGTPLNIALSPMMGGIINAVITAMIIAIGCKGAPKFGSSIIIWVSFSIPAIFTLTMGPPGFHKIIIAFLTGLTMDILFAIFGRTKLMYFIVGGIMSDVMTILTLLAMIVLSMSPESVKKLSEYIWLLIPLYFFLGGIGMYLGFNVYEKRIKNLSIIKTLFGN